jgi:glutathionylspermidine synthase
MSNVALDKVYMRDILIKEKLFLLKLFQNQQPNVLISASIFQMNIVIRIIHLLLNNEIELLEENYKALKQSKRLKMLLQNFDSEKNFLRSLYLQPEAKQALLKKFTACYPYLFYSIFIKN